MFSSCAGLIAYKDREFVRSVLMINKVPWLYHGNILRTNVTSSSAQHLLESVFSTRYFLKPALNRADTAMKRLNEFHRERKREQINVSLTKEKSIPHLHINAYPSPKSVSRV